MVFGINSTSNDIEVVRGFVLLRPTLIAVYVILQEISGTSVNSLD